MSAFRIGLQGRYGIRRRRKRRYARTGRYVYGGAVASERQRVGLLSYRNGYGNVLYGLYRKARKRRCANVKFHANGSKVAKRNVHAALGYLLGRNPRYGRRAITYLVTIRYGRIVHTTQRSAPPFGCAFCVAWTKGSTRKLNCYEFTRQEKNGGFNENARRRARKPCRGFPEKGNGRYPLYHPFFIYFT